MLLKQGEKIFAKGVVTCKEVGTGPCQEITGLIPFEESNWSH